MWTKIPNRLGKNVSVSAPKVATHKLQRVMNAAARIVK